MMTYYISFIFAIFIPLIMTSSLVMGSHLGNTCPILGDYQYWVTYFQQLPSLQKKKQQISEAYNRGSHPDIWTEYVSYLLKWSANYWAQFPIYFSL